MEVLRKVLSEREKALESYKELEELEKRVALTKTMLQIFGTKEEIEKDIEELKRYIGEEQTTEQELIEEQNIIEEKEELEPENEIEE